MDNFASNSMMENFLEMHTKYRELEKVNETLRLEIDQVHGTLSELIRQVSDLVNRYSA